jgi:hypothetical protein
MVYFLSDAHLGSRAIENPQAHQETLIAMLENMAKDATAISFEEKLGKYLSSVLVSDETAQKIRQAFDAYIFLSYRKKDRALAQKLMRLIHENEFARDIAIWYDEFLVPGEDWSEAIAAALDKSRLFALAVTPNLLEEGNFVKNVEYPAARDAGKPIVAAEVAETDREALKNAFPDLPSVVGAESPALPEALLRALSGIAVRENDADPVHNFFIGLAYLSGIDVERCPDRALDLITASADAKAAVAFHDGGRNIAFEGNILMGETRSVYVGRKCEMPLMSGNIGMGELLRELAEEKFDQ